MKEEQIRIAGEILSDPRNQKQEVQALQDTKSVVGGKWRLLIINSICNGSNRFCDIQRSIPGITTRKLSRELKEMGSSPLIKRNVTPDTTALVEYTEADYCMSVGGIILEMISWGKQASGEGNEMIRVSKSGNRSISLCYYNEIDRSLT